MSRIRAGHGPAKHQTGRDGKRQKTHRLKFKSPLGHIADRPPTYAQTCWLQEKEIIGEAMASLMARLPNVTTSAHAEERTLENCCSTLTQASPLCGGELPRPSIARHVRQVASRLA